MEDDRYAWFDATAENGDTLNYKKRMQGKGNQVTADKADFPSFASTGIHSEEEIRNTRSITGRSVSQDHRGRKARRIFGCRVYGSG